MSSHQLSEEPQSSQESPSSKQPINPNQEGIADSHRIIFVRVCIENAEHYGKIGFWNLVRDRFQEETNIRYKHADSAMKRLENCWLWGFHERGKNSILPIKKLDSAVFDAVSDWLEVKARYHQTRPLKSLPEPCILRLLAYQDYRRAMAKQRDEHNAAGVEETAIQAQVDSKSADNDLFRPDEAFAQPCSTDIFNTSSLDSPSHSVHTPSIMGGTQQASTLFSPELLTLIHEVAERIQSNGLQSDDHELQQDIQQLRLRLTDYTLVQLITERIQSDDPHLEQGIQQLIGRLDDDSPVYSNTGLQDVHEMLEAELDSMSQQQ